MNTQRDRAASDVTAGRIPDGGFRQLGLINWVFNKIAARVARVPRIHLITTLGQHRRLFWAWYLFGAVLYAGRLPRPDTELVILRVAHLRGCEYELQQHRRLAERKGLDAELQQRIFDWPNAEGFSPRRQALLYATDEFVERRTISRDTWEALQRYLNTRQLIEFCMLAGQYDALAATMSALEMPLDFPSEQAS